MIEGNLVKTIHLIRDSFKIYLVPISEQRLPPSTTFSSSEQLTHLQTEGKMSAKSKTANSYHLGSLPKKIKDFIEASSDTVANTQRSHSHHSLVNAYMVATFLEEANQYVPPMKRDAGLRDLAQRLHLWPGDMAMQLQRDALQAIGLLEKYVEQILTEELRFVQRTTALDSEESRQRLKDLAEMRVGALVDLHQLKDELRNQVSRHHLDFASTDLELHDLSPFIPGFTSARAKGIQSLTTRSASSSTKSVADLSASFNLLVSSGLSPERTEALAAIEKFRDSAKSVAQEFTDLIGNGSMSVLDEKVHKIADVQEALETMGTGLYRLLNAGGTRDHEGGGSSEKMK